MTKNKKFIKCSILIIFVALFVISTIFAFSVSSTAYAYETITTYQTFRYLDYIPLYQLNNTTGGDIVYNFNNYVSMWYMRFEFYDNIPTFFMYFLDHNYNEQSTAVDLDYSSEYYQNGMVKSAQSLTGTTSYRWFDYVAVLHNYTGVMYEKTTPTFLTITYTSLDSSSLVATYDWTVKRSSNGLYLLVTYTFGNEDYAFDISFPILTNSDFIDFVRGNTNKTYSYTTYFSSSSATNNEGTYASGYNAGFNAGKNQSVGNAYQEGYDAGYGAGETYGKETADSTVNKDSASYFQGIQDALNEDNPYTFGGLFGAIADSQLDVIGGLLGFEFLGINMLSMFKFLITLGLVFCVLRMLKG